MVLWLHSVVPRAIVQLGAHGKLHSLLGHLRIVLFRGMQVDASEKPGAQHVCIVDAAFTPFRFSPWQRSVAETEVSVRLNPAEFIDDKLGRIPGDVEVAVLPEGLIGIEKCVADQAGPDHRGRPQRNASSPGLVVEMVAPAISLESRRAILDQPIQAGVHFLEVITVPIGLKQP